jgi:hypothetical protein
MTKSVIGKTNPKSRRHKKQKKSRKTLKRRQRGGEIKKIERGHNRTYRINTDIIGHYEGDWDTDTQKPHGKGMLTINSKGNRTYTGDWVQGKRQGQGQMSYHSPKEPLHIVDIYEGNWEDDKRNGKGKLIRRDYTTMGVTILEDGIWENDVYMGKE